MDTKDRPRRHIVTFWPAGSVAGESMGIDEVTPRGEVHHTGSPEAEAAETAAALARVDQLVEALRDEIGFKRMDAILTAVNHLQMAIRNEAIARLVAAAGEMVDYSIAVYVPPEV